MRLFVFKYSIGDEQPDALIYIYNNKDYYEVVGYDEDDIMPYIEFGTWAYVWESRGRYL